MMRKALVIGGAGHIGNAITRALLDNNSEVVVIGRRAAPPLNLSDLALTYTTGYADAPDRFERWIGDCDLVVDAAAPYPLQGFSLLKPALTTLEYAEKRTARLIETVIKKGAALIY